MDINEVQKNFRQADKRAVDTRAAHSRPYGVYEAHVTFDPKNLSPEYRFGLFSKRASYLAWIRISQASGSTRHTDKDRDQFGFAMKVLGPSMASARDPKTCTQIYDFLLTNRPTTFVKDAKEQMDLFRSSSRGRLPNLWFIARHLDQAPKIFRDTGRKITSLRTETFWSRTPYLLWDERKALPQSDAEVGNHAVKYVIFPCGREPGAANELTSEELKSRSDNYLLEDLNSSLRKNDLCYHLGVQIRQPEFSLDDPRKEWPSPTHIVATITIPAGQNEHIDSALKHNSALATGTVVADFGERLAFNPWNTGVVHFPWGDMNKARKDTLEQSQALRAQSGNYVKIVAPTAQSFRYLR